MALIYRIVPDLFNNLKYNKRDLSSEAVLYQLGYMNFYSRPYFTVAQDIGDDTYFPGHRVGEMSSFNYDGIHHCTTKSFFLFPQDAVLAFNTLCCNEEYFFLGCRGGAVVLEYDIPMEILKAGIGIGNYDSNYSKYFSATQNTCPTNYYPVLEFAIGINELMGNTSLVNGQDEALRSKISCGYKTSHKNYVDMLYEIIGRDKELCKSVTKEQLQAEKEKILANPNLEQFCNVALQNLGDTFISQFITGRTIYLTEESLPSCKRSSDFSPIIEQSQGMIDDRAQEQFFEYKGNYKEILKQMGFKYSFEQSGMALIYSPMTASDLSDSSVDKQLRYFSREYNRQ